MDLESQVHIPAEIWSKIFAFLPIDDLCRVEGVDHHLSVAAKVVWDQLKLKSLSIAPPMINSTPKFATLMRRCGPHLEEIIVGRHVKLDKGAKLFRLCPNLKTLTFTGGKSFSLARHASEPEAQVNSSARGFLEQFHQSTPKLKRLQLYSSIDYSGRNVITLRWIIPGLMHMPNLRELHLPLTWFDGPSVKCIEAFKHTRVLSIMVPERLVFDPLPTNFAPFSPSERSSFMRFGSGSYINSSLHLIVSSICQLHQMEQLYMRISPPTTPLFEFTVVTRLAESMPKLNSLVLRFDWRTDGFGIMINTPMDCINAIISQLTQLRTLVIVGPMRMFESIGNDPFRRVLVDLSQHHYRQVPLNIFVADYNLPNFNFNSIFTGNSPQINIIPMPNGQYGEAIDFVSTYDQNGFDFGAQKCLQMVKRSSQFKGEWDFFYERRNTPIDD